MIVGPVPGPFAGAGRWALAYAVRRAWVGVASSFSSS